MASVYIFIEFTLIIGRVESHLDYRLLNTINVYKCVRINMCVYIDLGIPRFGREHSTSWRSAYVLEKHFSETMNAHDGFIKTLTGPFGTLEDCLRGDIEGRESLANKKKAFARHSSTAPLPSFSRRGKKHTHQRFMVRYPRSSRFVTFYSTSISFSLSRPTGTNYQSML